MEMAVMLLLVVVVIHTWLGVHLVAQFSAALVIQVIGVLAFLFPLNYSDAETSSACMRSRLRASFLGWYMHLIGSQRHQCTHWAVVGISCKSIRSHKQTHFVKRLLYFICPFNRSFLFQTGFLCQQFKDMCATRPHVRIVIHAANEYAQFCGIAGTIHMKDGADLLFPRFYTSCCKPITKLVSFSDGPFAFEWVYGKTIFA